MPPRERRDSNDRRSSTQAKEAELAEAIAADEIQILFQPQFACEGNALNGGEALARWSRPGGPEALFALARATGTQVALTRHIANLAFAQAARWPDPLRLSLNVTAADLAAEDFAPWIETALAKAGLPCERLTLEITEQALVRDVERSAGKLADIAERGARIALDDFGAGFCNFRYLKLLPLDYLKLDRTMVDGITACERDLAVLRAIVAMARALGIEVIAEGIESEDQLAAVRAEGCAAYQGFLRAEPMTPAAFLRLAGS